VAERIAVHSERDRLTDVEIRKITESRVRYEKLPDILLNVYYQKDEPSTANSLREAVAVPGLSFVTSIWPWRTLLQTST